MAAVSVIRKPVITERTTLLQQHNQYVVEVSPQATKGQIRDEVENRFKVTVLGIQTVKVRGKYRRRVGPHGGYQPNSKKAIVKLKQGQKITWEETK